VAKNRRTGIWRCLGCSKELLAIPDPKTKHHHRRLHTYAPKDSIRKWHYDSKNDLFIHEHGGKIPPIRAEFVEDLGDE
jgi:hypothetical protein